MSMTTIEPNFRIPQNYERMFLLQINDFQYCIIANSGGFHTGQRGVDSPANHSRVLDFIQESMEGVRAECEKLNRKRKNNL